MNKLLVLILFILPLRLSALELTFEPYLGPYLFGSYEEGSSSSINGLGIGAKAGAFFGGAFIAGVELSTAALEVDKNPSEDHEQQGIGAFGGVIIPGLPMRTFITYYPFYFSRISGGRRLDGLAVKLGLGISPFPLPISFNMEYITATFSSENTGGREVKMTPEASSQNLIFSISFPLSSPL
ncbi:MAG: hypothetical protein Fur0010_01470 [Bdellovibrio sp.]